MINICKLYNKTNRIYCKILAWCVNEEYIEPIIYKEVNIITALLEMILWGIFLVFIIIIFLLIKSIVYILTSPILFFKCDKQ